MAKDKKHSKNDVDADEALSRAHSAAGDLKPKDQGLYWATLAQALMLQEIRDMMHDDRTNRGSVQLPEEAPGREPARVTVNEQ